METLLAILGFLIPGLVCYWYNQWRERKRNEKLWEQAIKGESLRQKWREAEQKTDGVYDNEGCVWFVDPDGNTRTKLDEDDEKKG
ncbi:hypothetical protein [Bacteroides faecium]|uniref:Uncharacterized protein n=1 Tax=Bacteroides faecium TaxID=2715212 RepID=A0A6H0KNK3_9BACE|nr:hypothetical protein [Bacteroides faecium]QIU95026.1 hypothetical protein BacF7301_13130 [Bacteroides faecium]